MEMFRIQVGCASEVVSTKVEVTEGFDLRDGDREGSGHVVVVEV